MQGGEQSIRIPVILGGVSWPLIVGTVAFLAALGWGSHMLVDGDTYWHIAVGRWIVEHRAVPHSDIFSFTALHRPWTAHEWLSEIALFSAFRAGGWPGVIALTATLFAVTLAYQTRILLRHLEPIHALVIIALAAGMISSHLLARPHLIAMPLILIWTAGLIQASEERRAPSPWLLAVMLLWANLHGSFTLGLALIAPFAIEAIIRESDKNARWVAGKRWLLFMLLAVCTSLITPYGVDGILFTSKVLGMSYTMDHIVEWASPNFHQFQDFEVGLLLLLCIGLGGYLRLPVVRLVILLGLTHLALKYVRYVELVGLLAPLLLAGPFAAQWYLRPKQGQQAESIDELFRGLSRPARWPVIVAAGVLLQATFLFMAQQGALQPLEKNMPVAAVSAVQKAGIEGPVFNEYRFGGYLIFSGIPVFIDGRADLYGDDQFKQYMTAVNLNHPGKLEQLLDKYHIRWTLLPPSAPAVSLLDHLPGWHRFYSDDIAVVHVRDTR